MTTKSTKVSLERAKAKDFQSIIFTPMTTKSAAKEAIGTHAIKGVKTKIAIKDHSPWRTPDKRVVPPLALLTKVAPMVPAPGVPPRRLALTLPRPWPTNSRLELWRLPVRASRTTQVFNVSIDNKIARVRAGIIICSNGGRLGWNSCSRDCWRFSNKAAGSAASGPIMNELFSKERSSGKADHAKSQ